MAWITVPNTDNVWEYENTANTANTYPNAPGTISGGIRTFTTGGVNPQENYVLVRKTGETIERGELNKDALDGGVF